MSNLFSYTVVCTLLLYSFCIDKVLVNGTSKANFTFEPREGEYDVVLFVSDNLANRVYWSRNVTKLFVKIDVEKHIKTLETKVASLELQVHHQGQMITDLTSQIAANMTQFLHGKNLYLQ